MIHPLSHFFAFASSGSCYTYYSGSAVLVYVCETNFFLEKGDFFPARSGRCEPFWAGRTQEIFRSRFCSVCHTVLMGALEKAEEEKSAETRILKVKVMTLFIWRRHPEKNTWENVVCMLMIDMSLNLWHILTPKRQDASTDVPPTHLEWSKSTEMKQPWTR